MDETKPQTSTKERDNALSGKRPCPTRRRLPWYYEERIDEGAEIEQDGVKHYH